MITDERFDQLVKRAQKHTSTITDELTCDTAAIFRVILDRLLENEYRQGNCNLPTGRPATAVAVLLPTTLNSYRA